MIEDAHSNKPSWVLKLTAQVGPNMQTSNHAKESKKLTCRHRSRTPKVRGRRCIAVGVFDSDDDDDEDDDDNDNGYA